MDTLKKAMLLALKKTYGRVSQACEMIEIARQSHYNWMNDDPEYREAVENIDDIAVDHVEGKLFEKIDGVQVQKGVTQDGIPIIYDVPPSDTAIIYYLNYKGKKRGYNVKAEDKPPSQDPEETPVIQLSNGRILKL